MRKIVSFRVRRLARQLVPAALALASACAATASSARAPAESPASAPSPDPERALASARDRLDIAKLQLALAEKRNETAMMRKAKDLELGRAELAQFDQSDAPNRLSKAKLDLARRRDALTEQKEELAQLQMLYEKEDLADKTREIVLQRGQRRVERAQDELAIQERETAALESSVLPRERAKLALEVEMKGRELEEAKGDGEATMREKRLAVRGAEDEVKKEEAKASSSKAKP